MGCSTNVPREKVCGSYVASYPFGTETITLKPDGTVEQQIVIKNQPPVTVQAKWEFDDKTSRIDFSGLKVVLDGLGQQRSNWQTAETGTVSRDLELHWSRVVMASAAKYPYVKR